MGAGIFVWQLMWEIAALAFIKLRRGTSITLAEKLKFYWSAWRLCLLIFIFNLTWKSLDLKWYEQQMPDLEQWNPIKHLWQACW